MNLHISRFLRSKRGIALLAVLAVFLLYWFRPGVGGLRTRITRSLSLALGRQVEVSSVSLRFLPQPGFDLENFVVQDDAALSAEPMLRAPEVTAVLRIASLLRGRLEIARLSFTDPSLNLARGSEGEWNVAQLFRRASQTSVAPTSQAHLTRVPVFPYIEAKGSRINFKFGLEKTPYILTDADFSLWQESSDEWGVRFRGVPLRTDYNITDTGILKLNGTWRRSAKLSETPLQVQFEWSQGQLGQVSKFVYGQDQGWRGNLTLAGSLKGSPVDLGVAVSASVDDFRRYDVAEGGAVQLRTDCSSKYSLTDRTFSELSCNSPVGDGQVLLSGNAAGWPASLDYDLQVLIKDVALNQSLDLLRHVKPNIPDNLGCDGKLQATLHWQGHGDLADATLAGQGEMEGLRLSSRSPETELNVGDIKFRVEPEPAQHASKRNVSPAAARAEQITFVPVSIQLGKNSAATLQASINRAGYQIGLKGDAQLPRLTHLAEMIGFHLLGPEASGAARLDLRVSGAWAKGPAETNGRIQLQSVRAPLQGLNQSLEIRGATLVLKPDETDVQHIEAAAAGTIWRGSVTIQRHCDKVPCPVQFELHGDEIDTDRLNQFFNSGEKPWYHFLSPSGSESLSLLSLNASGELSADRLVIHGLVATNASADLELKKGKLTAENLTATLLGGKHTGQWTADFGSSSPSYQGSGGVERASLEQVAALTHDTWVNGTANLRYETSFSGSTAAQILASGQATGQIEARDGSFPHIPWGDSLEPLPFQHVTGHFVLRSGLMSWSDARLDTGESVYLLSGTASIARDLKLRLTPAEGPAVAITGTLAQPHVSTLLNPSQAKLKSEQ